MFTLDILIPWKNRKELQQCLDWNSDFFATKAVEPNFIVINCGGDQQQALEMVNNANTRFSIHLIHLAYGGFNKALALNVGLLQSKAEHVMVLDTDVLLQALDMAQLKAAISGNAFVTIERILEEKPMPEDFPEADALLEIGNYIEFKSANGNTAMVEMNRQGLVDKSRSGPGMIIASRKALMEIEGYNSELEGWGWEDLDLITRLQLEAGRQRVPMGEALHMTHNDDVRYIRPEFSAKGQNEQHNFQVCIINYRLGILTGSLEEDRKYLTQLEEAYINGGK